MTNYPFAPEKTEFDNQGKFYTLTGCLTCPYSPHCHGQKDAVAKNYYYFIPAR